MYYGEITVALKDNHPVYDRTARRNYKFHGQLFSIASALLGACAKG